ncbi:hypothetical protein JOB18_000930 [Solea senegalensis]|uniref:Uncharacterized protein n=1 Tax=Solea senegalensis TaxID=28829 RepID=A0AAV6T2J2_SOLSE|nr:hypothetical protein JOB18_000930 [Solea senegalensis]
MGSVRWTSLRRRAPVAAAVGADSLFWPIRLRGGAFPIIYPRRRGKKQNSVTIKYPHCHCGRRYAQVVSEMEPTCAVISTPCREGEDKECVEYPKCTTRRTFNPESTRMDCTQE